MSIQFFSIKERDSRSFSVSRSENLQLPNQKNLRIWKDFLTMTKKIESSSKEKQQRILPSPQEDPFV
jgi:hypothetical protein